MSRILDTITKDNVNIPFIGPDGNVVGTPLFSAISEDRMDYIDQFIELGADVNIVVNYETPLITAILKGNIDVVNRLLLADADPNLIPDRDYSPLGVAVCRHNIDIIKLLMSFGANINYEDRNRTSSVLGMLLLSRRYDLTPESYDVFNFLFQNGLDISRSIHDWVSFLLIKLIDTYSDFIDGLKILKLFLEYCANPNIDYVIRKTFGYRRTHYDDNLILMLLLGGTIFEENFLENMITYNRLSSISYILENKLVSKQYILNHPELIKMTDRDEIVRKNFSSVFNRLRGEELLHEIDRKGHIGILLRQYIYS